MSEPCPTCRGLGYLIDQGYYRYEMPPTAVPVQRCDECRVFEGDIEAAVEAGRRCIAFVGYHHPKGDPDEIAIGGDVWLTFLDEESGPKKVDEEDE